MNRITLYPPELTKHEVTFRWDIEPPSALYQKPQFTLRFPETVDLSKVPDSLWWTITFICLHAQWAVLRPCQVRLPVKLRPGEVECWGRLLDTEIATLETYRGSGDYERKIEILEGSEPLAPFAPLPEVGRCATAFSGGKDSLLQVGILTELSQRPVLVTTTSPMPPLADHITARRRHILKEIVARRDVDLIEVESDFRANWNNDFARGLGYQISINEITDTFLYFSSTLIASLALGATHMFLASENEVQENIELDGRVIQHPHFMYSVITQRTLQALLRPLGISYSSLTSPLHSFQVQELLWTRYRDLRDLQYSCWRVGLDQAACNNCTQCLRIAVCALALNDLPSLMGMKLVPLLNAMRDWVPKDLDDAGSTLLPKDLVSHRLIKSIARYLKSIPLRRIVTAIARENPKHLLSRPGWDAVRAYQRLRGRAIGYRTGVLPGYRPGFLRFVDPLLRDSLAAIYDEHYQLDDEAVYADMLNRCEALANWIIEPLGGRSAFAKDLRKSDLGSELNRVGRS